MDDGCGWNAMPQGWGVVLVVVGGWGFTSVASSEMQLETTSVQILIENVPAVTSFTLRAAAASVSHYVSMSPSWSMTGIRGEPLPWRPDQSHEFTSDEEEEGHRDGQEHHGQ